MDCKQCSENMTAFLDSELPAREAEEVKSHVSRCSSCAEELEGLRQSAAFLESHNRERELRPEAWNLVRARISLQPVPASRPFLYRGRFAFAALALLAALLLGYLYHQQAQQQKVLEQYVSRYIREREADRQARPPAPSAAPYVENPYAGNPFLEVRATDSDNPFQSEDR